MQRARPVSLRSLAAAVVPVVFWAFGLVAGAGSVTAEARPAGQGVAVGSMDVADLPPQGRAVLERIRSGGSFGSRRDGATFGNREGILPRRRTGDYAEFTVPTPGARTRGARRIVAGRGTSGDFRTSGEYYYSDDHYQSFRRIRLP